MSFFKRNTSKFESRILGANHCQKHLETVYGLKRMRDVCGQDDHVSLTSMDSIASDGNLSIAIDDLHNRIVRRGMLAQALPGIERKQRDSARFRVDQGLAYYRISRIFDKCFCINCFTFVYISIWLKSVPPKY